MTRTLGTKATLPTLVERLFQLKDMPHPRYPLPALGDAQIALEGHPRYVVINSNLRQFMNAFYFQRYNPGNFGVLQYKCPGCENIYYDNGGLANHLLDIPDCQEAAGPPESWGTHLHEFRLMAYATSRQWSSRYAITPSILPCDNMILWFMV